MIDRLKPGLVALYDIRPGNGAGPFYNPGDRTGPRKLCNAVKQYTPHICGLLRYGTRARAK